MVGNELAWESSERCFSLFLFRDKDSLVLFLHFGNVLGFNENFLFEEKIKRFEGNLPRGFLTS